MKDNIYRVAELDMKILFAESTTNNEQLIESFEPFRVSALKGSILFHLTVDDNTRPYPKENAKESETSIQVADTPSLTNSMMADTNSSFVTSMMPTVRW